MISNLLARFTLWILGWKTEGNKSPHKKYVMIAAPHTTNMDGLLLLAAAGFFRMKISWMIKHTMLKIPIFGWLLKSTGAVAINRTAKQGLVQQMIQKFAEKEEFILAIPPAGTRSYRDYWKSGFYVIAKEAGVPIVPGYLNYKTRVAGFGESFIPSDVKKDMDYLRKFYKDITPRYPQKKSRIKLALEDEAEKQESA
ncbi:1-acyl-sn-glycerol-3-phosphate acyltransferase [Candidatus Uabimicrobium sp. HlEnr_7]|uniref:1-acyl-sn-glycerol-3-phosphate acyltransferase n=1 Tax=Candidatus Uabimicrobium helgolandensis TaxID=3095367 RepID=UPI0035586234